MHESAIEASKILQEERNTASYTRRGRRREAIKGATDQHDKEKHDAYSCQHTKSGT
jgi:hypothetical protein